MRYLKVIGITLLGVVVIGFAIDVLWLFLDSDHTITLYNLAANIIPGLIIGPVALFMVFVVMVFLRKKPVMGYLTNFIVIALLFLVLFLLQDFRQPYSVVIPQWIAIFLLVEALSSVVVILIYKRNFFYNSKLEQKKASLKQLTTRGPDH